MTELMSLQSIETLASETSDKWTIAATNHLLETARVAHELKAVAAKWVTENGMLKAHREETKEHIEFLYRELAKARAEERERCAKLADSYLNYGLNLDGLAKDIRELK